VAQWTEAVLGGRSHLNRFQLTAEKLGGASASDADQVVVMLVLIEGFDAPDAVPQLDFLRDSTFEKEIYGAVDSRIPGRGIDLPHSSDQIVDVYMMFRGKENIEDEIPLLGLFETFAGQVVVEESF